MQPAELGWGTHEKKLPEDGAYHTHGALSDLPWKKSIEVPVVTPSSKQEEQLCQSMAKQPQAIKTRLVISIRKVTTNGAGFSRHKLRLVARACIP